MVDIYDYHDPVDFLRDAYDARKAESGSFSHRHICRRLGVRSHSFFSDILSRRSRIPRRLVAKLAAAFDLSTADTEYFEALTMLQRATEPGMKAWITRQLSRMKSARSELLGREHEETFNSWYTSALRFLVYCNGSLTPAEMARLLRPTITTEQARRALKTLIRNGTVRRDGKTGALVLERSRTTTGMHFPNKELLDEYHIEMIELAVRAVHQYPRDRRQVSGITMAISEEGYKQVLDIMARARQEILAAVSHDTDVDRVYQVNQQIFPLSKIPCTGEPKPHK